MAEDPTTATTFVLPPPIPGDWIILADDVADLLRARLGECGFQSIDPGSSALVRVLPLEFWNGWFLCDVQPAGPVEQDGTASSLTAPLSIHSFVYGPDGFTPLDGKSAAIHEHNARHGLNITSAENQRSYLRFFCYFVRGENGPFEIVEDAGRLAGDDIADIDKAVYELSLAGGNGTAKGNETKTYKASIVYGDALFSALLALHGSGMVEMLEDDPIKESVHTIPRLNFAATARSSSTTPEGKL